MKTYHKPLLPSTVSQDAGRGKAQQEHFLYPIQPTVTENANSTDNARPLAAVTSAARKNFLDTEIQVVLCNQQALLQVVLLLFLVTGIS